MANTLLTDIKITRKALAILHNKSTFIGTIGRQYDDQFQNAGGKIGSQLKIRMPNQYAFRRGPVAQMQSTTEQSVILTLASIGGTDMDFADTDLAMSLDDFSERILDPAVAVIIANIESDALTAMYADVYQHTGTPGATPAGILPFLNAKTLLNQSLTPKGNRKVQLDSITSAAMANGMTNFFHPSKEVEGLYLEGEMGHASGFDFYENELTPVHTTGTMTGVAGAQVNSVGVGGRSVVLGGFTAGATITRGTVFTMAGCNKVHPETKKTFGTLQQFVVSMDDAGTGTYTAAGDGTVTLNISPAIVPVVSDAAVAAGAQQNPLANVTANPTLTTAGSAVFVGAASTSYGQNLTYDKSAFTFVTGDLTLPKGMDMAYREVSEGISLRILRGFDIINNVFLSRLDVLYGYLTTRAQCAARVTR